MKKTFILLLLISSSVFSQRTLVNQTLNALKQNDKQSFKELFISRDLLNKTSDTYISLEKYNQMLDNRANTSFRKFENLFYNIKTYEIIKISSPTKEYKWKGLTLINFYVILKNKSDHYVKVLFRDCSKINGKYYLSESLGFAKK
jgi:hypothetical protein